MLIPIRRDGLEPVWKQIEAGIRERICRGSLEGGRPLPPPVELARALRCHPAAVARAYVALARAGWLDEGPAGVPLVSDRGGRKRRRAVEAGLRHLIDRLLRQARALDLGAGELEQRIEERRGPCLQRSRSRD